jgi:rhodanese-related sulfurtransferase
MRSLLRLLVVGLCGIASACGNGQNSGRVSADVPDPSGRPLLDARDAGVSAELREAGDWAVAQFDVPAASAPRLLAEHFAADRSPSAGAPPMPLWIDTRERGEFDVSHLPGALWWNYRGDAPPLAAIASAAAEGRPIVLYCSIGYRSGEAGEKLLAALRPDDPARPGIANLRGGIFEWAVAGGPLEGGAQVHPYDATWGKLLPAALRSPLP